MKKPKQKKRSLVAIAKKMPKKRNRNFVGVDYEHIELALAYLRGEIGLTQAAGALKVPTNRAHTLMQRFLEVGIKSNILKVSFRNLK